MVACTYKTKQTSEKILKINCSLTVSSISITKCFGGNLLACMFIIVFVWETRKYYKNKNNELYLWPPFKAQKDSLQYINITIKVKIK